MNDGIEFQHKKNLMSLQVNALTGNWDLWVKALGWADTAIPATIPLAEAIAKVKEMYTGGQKKFLKVRDRKLRGYW